MSDDQPSESTESLDAAARALIPHLRQSESPLLDGPSPDYPPEVNFIVE
ncbi:MAG: hypothetical protein JXQ72_16980 [Anaerolineae bacterium]|nr:hypothetical protein [Anaerolineae bacterium]